MGQRNRSEPQTIDIIDKCYDDLFSFPIDKIKYHRPVCGKLLRYKYQPWVRKWYDDRTVIQLHLDVVTKDTNEECTTIWTHIVVKNDDKDQTKAKDICNAWKKKHLNDPKWDHLDPNTEYEKMEITDLKFKDNNSW